MWSWRVISGEVAVGTALADRFPLHTATGWRVFVTGVSHAYLSSDFPLTRSKNARWIFSVTGPRAPLPTVMRSTERIDARDEIAEGNLHLLARGRIYAITFHDVTGLCTSFPQPVDAKCKKLRWKKVVEKAGSCGK